MHEHAALRRRRRAHPRPAGRACRRPAARAPPRPQRPPCSHCRRHRRRSRRAKHRRDRAGSAPSGRSGLAPVRVRRSSSREGRRHSPPPASGSRACRSAPGVRRLRQGLGRAAERCGSGLRRMSSAGVVGLSSLRQARWTRVRLVGARCRRRRAAVRRGGCPSGRRPLDLRRRVGTRARLDRHELRLARRRLPPGTSCCGASSGAPGTGCGLLGRRLSPARPLRAYPRSGSQSRSVAPPPRRSGLQPKEEAARQDDRRTAMTPLPARILGRLRPRHDQIQPPAISPQHGLGLRRPCAETRAPKAIQNPAQICRPPAAERHARALCTSGGLRPKRRDRLIGGAMPVR